jgi:phenol 2-monooxygenase
MPMQLGHVLKADGRFRVIASAPADDAGQPGGPIAGLCSLLDDRTDIGLRAVFQQSHRDLDVGALPARLFPRSGRLRLVDYEKVFCPDFEHGSDIFDLRGIDRVRGALVVVRPDQYVAAVLPLDADSDLDRALLRL